MKDLLLIVQAVGFVAAIVCFFWALKYRRDRGITGPQMGISKKKLTAFYGPKGGKIALFGTISFYISGSAMLARWILGKGD